MSNLQTYYHFKLDFQKVDQHTGGKWLIHGTKRRKDNQLQSLELSCRYNHNVTVGRKAWTMFRGNWIKCLFYKWNRTDIA